MVTLPLLRVRFLPWDAVLPKLILHRLPSGCSSNITPCYGAHPSGTAPAWVPMGSSFPSLPATLQLLSEPVPVWAQHGPCHLQASSTAALWAPPWLHVEICSVWCPWAAGGQPAPLWASPGLQGAAAVCLEHHLLPSSCADLGGCRATSVPSLTPLSQLQLHSTVSLPPILSPIGGPSITHSSALPSGSLWEHLELLCSGMGHCGALLTGRPTAPATNTLLPKPSITRSA